MSLDENEKEKLRIEKLIAEINTRENSTLVLSTVASSVSVAILTVLFNESINTRVSWGFFGFLFATLGFAYRELTIHFSEIRSYRRLREKLALTEDVSFAVFLRMFVVRWFLILPSAIFFYLIGFSSEIVCLGGALILSLVFALCELVRRIDC